MEVYHNRPSFADADAQEDARNRLAHVSMLQQSILLSCKLIMSFTQANIQKTLLVGGDF